jgi:hypothetical protein
MDIQEQLDQLAQRVDSLSADPKSSHRASPADLQTALQTDSQAGAQTTPTTSPTPQPPTLQVARPSQNVVTMTIGGQTVSLGPHDISEMIDQLAQARTTMLPEVPMTVVPGKPFAATKDPVIASQTVANGEKLLVLRHTGYGWVPFSCSPRMLVDMLAVLSRK